MNESIRIATAQIGVQTASPQDNSFRPIIFLSGMVTSTDERAICFKVANWEEKVKHYHGTPLK